MNPSFRAIRARARRQPLRTLLIASAASAGTGLLLTACSASLGSAGGGSNTTAGHLAAGNGAARQGAVPAPAYGPSSAQQRGALSALTLSTQSIIYTADLTLRVKDVTAAGTAATDEVTAVGGYVSSEQEIIPQTKQGIPQINLVLKIPVAQYGQTFAKLSQLGKPLAHSQRAVDVTQRVADVSSRVASAQAAISQLRALLKKAGSVGQLLSVQNEINSQESNLEALLAQQRTLAHQTSYATVTVVLVGQHARPVHKHHRASAGFAAGLRGGWHALRLVVRWLLTALGSVLPFLVPVALIGGIVFESRRRLARRKKTPAPEPPAASAS